jgi:hypothetical protein
MKKYSLIVIINILVAVLVLMPQFSTAQKNADSVQQNKFENLVASQHYTFIAESATTASGRLRMLDVQYDLQVSKEKVTADLPYFGTAYFSPVNPSETGIKFTSKDFDYNLVKRKKDGWEILIKSKDISNAQNLNLTVYSNGKATLQVTSNSRQGISFNGYIVSPDKEIK